MKKLLLLIILGFAFMDSRAQNLDSTALILIDIQEFYFPEGKTPLSEPEKAEEKAQILLKHFRNNNGIVVHVRHDYEPGGNIRKAVQPFEGEKVISKKEVSAFLKTDLDNYLKSKGVYKLVLCGMQTHMCLEAATRSAHDLGYNCTVIGDACATRDLKYNDFTVKAADVHYSTLATLKSYATVLSLGEYLKQK